MLNSMDAGRFHTGAGAWVSLLLVLAVFPVRLAQGQGSDPVNLIGSQTVVFILCFACWTAILFFLTSEAISTLAVKLVLAMLACVSLSVAFYYLSNTWFEDYPLSPVKSGPKPQGLLALAYRGGMIFFAMCPPAYYLAEGKKIRRRCTDAERLQRENLKAGLDSLRQQLNPHFLFNALNVLKSGATEEWVKVYVVQLANVYRYLLRYTQDDNLVRIAKEVDFIEAYTHILTERYGTSLQVTIRLSEQVPEKLIPPLALQLLVENAVKHNKVSTANPLCISIFDEARHLVVANNRNPLEKKRVFHPGDLHGIGLKNLKERYALLAGEQILVTGSAENFIVKLPLLENDRPDHRR